MTMRSQIENVTEGLSCSTVTCRKLPYSRKFYREIKFGSLAVKVETTKLKSANILALDYK